MAHRVVVPLLIIVSLAVTFVALYQQYGGIARTMLFGAPPTYQIAISNAPISVTVARTLAEQTKGLSGTTSLAPDSGMLFLFKTPGPQGIWMPDMHYAIDVMWFDANQRLVHVVEDMTPASYPTIYSSSVPAQYVVEANVGFVATHHIALGDHLTLPENFRAR